MILLLFFILPLICTEVIKSIVNDYEARLAMCNDLSPAYYYVQMSSNISSKWVIYLEGGGGCYDTNSCNERWTSFEGGMSSLSQYYYQQPDNTTYGGSGSGIMSRDCENNPAFCEYNFAFLPYCSSDWWSGNHSASSTQRFSFFGKNILKSVVEDLVKFHGLEEATKVVLSGGSAGGVGVLSNSDYVHQILKTELSNRKFEYSVLSDSSFFLDGNGYKEYECENSGVCWIEKRMMSGQPMWNLIPHEKCGLSFPESERWKCLIGRHVYPFIEAKKLVVFNIWDMWQFWQDIGEGVYNVQELDEGKKKWLLSRGEEVYQNIKELDMKNHGVVAIGCYSHGTLTSLSVPNVKSLSGVAIKDLINEWDQGGTPYSVDICSDVPCNPYCIDNGEEIIFDSRNNIELKIVAGVLGGGVSLLLGSIFCVCCCFCGAMCLLYSGYKTKVKIFKNCGGGHKEYEDVVELPQEETPLERIQ